MNERFDLFAPLCKVDKSQRMVWGWASTERKDLQGEVMKADAIEEALPDYMEWRNIREMHQPSAVGVATEAGMQDRPDGSRGLYIGAKISDDDAWKKVEDGVYKGFSVGGNKLAKLGNEITKVRMVEISLVDRPANPDCKIDVIKVAGKAEANAIADPNDLADVSAGGDAAIPADEVGVLKAAFEKLAHAFGFQKRIEAAPEAKAAPVILAAEGDDALAKPTDVQKSMYEVASMAEAYECLQRIKRCLKTESMWEGDDPADLECARKVREIAEMIGELMIAHIGHEMEEDADDEDDAAHSMQGEISMAATATDLTKRFTASNKASLAKAADHVEKAAKFHKAMGGHLAKAMSMYSGDAVEKAAKGKEDKFDHEAMKSHLEHAQAAHESMEDHLDVAASHLDKCMKGITPDETEGHEEGKSTEEMEKAATPATEEDEEAALIKVLANTSPKALKKYLDTIRTEGVTEAIIAKAANTPANAGHLQPRLFAMPKGAADAQLFEKGANPDKVAATPNEAAKGIEKDDPNGVGKAFAKMLRGNAGRSVLTDPTFKGTGGGAS